MIVLPSPFTTLPNKARMHWWYTHWFFFLFLFYHCNAKSLMESLYSDQNQSNHCKGCPIDFHTYKINIQNFSWTICFKHVKYEINLLQGATYQLFCSSHFLACILFSLSCGTESTAAFSLKSPECHLTLSPMYHQDDDVLMKHHTRALEIMDSMGYT